MFDLDLRCGSCGGVLAISPQTTRFTIYQGEAALVDMTVTCEADGPDDHQPMNVYPMPFMAEAARSAGYLVLADPEQPDESVYVTAMVEETWFEGLCVLPLNHRTAA